MAPFAFKDPCLSKVEGLIWFEKILSDHDFKQCILYDEIDTIECTQLPM